VPVAATWQQARNIIKRSSAAASGQQRGSMAAAAYVGVAGNSSVATRGNDALWQHQRISISVAWRASALTRSA